MLPLLPPLSSDSCEKTAATQLATDSSSSTLPKPSLATPPHMGNNCESGSGLLELLRVICGVSNAIIVWER